MEINEWTPLHTRFISHRIGDGTVNVYGKPVWDNKHITEFVKLAEFLNFKLWKPVKGDSFGTYKIVMPRYAFEKFGKIFNKDIEMLIQDPVYLLDAIKELPEEHKLQTILALITDDGSCKGWLLVVFEDQNKETVDKVLAHRLI